MPEIARPLFLIATMLFFYAPTTAGGMSILMAGIGFGLVMLFIGKYLYSYDNNDI